MTVGATKDCQSVVITPHRPRQPTHPSTSDFDKSTLILTKIRKRPGRFRVTDSLQTQTGRTWTLLPRPHPTSRCPKKSKLRRGLLAFGRKRKPE